MKKSIYLQILFLIFLPFISSGQQSLKLSSCEIEEFEINDHSDFDGDGNVCEAKIVLSKSAFYTENEFCDLSNINWIILVDLYADGVNDLEYRSDLPSTDTSLDDTNGNGIPDLYIPATMNNELQNIELPDIEGPFSEHSVSWKVLDDCDIIGLCVTTFIVADKKSPTPYCVSLSTAVYNGNVLEIHAEDFNIGAFDNCTHYEDIRISFSGESIVPTRLITCDDVFNSPVLLKIYFWDDYNNIDFCQVYLSVFAGPGADCFQEGEIAGFVRDWAGNPIEDVEVTLEVNLPEFPQSRFTDAEGKYSFGTLPTLVDYKLSASLDEDYLNGVSTLDLVLIVRHILGIKPFINPYQIIAADINGDNKIKANDLTTLRKLILGVISKFSTNTSWRFIAAEYEFINPTNPFPELQAINSDPFVIKFNQINGESYDFIGIKIGNINP